MQDPSITGSPFEESLGTAISARIDAATVQQPVLPSYPNGLQVHPQSWRDAAVPLRHAAAGLSEGVGEGFGRLRRELGKVTKSPRTSDVPRHAKDSLTFDENEVVSVHHDGNTEGGATSASLRAPRSQPGDSSTGSESTLSTANVGLDGADSIEEWQESEVANEVAEYEAFETFGLGVVGEMDEDSQSVRKPRSKTTSRRPPLHQQASSSMAQPPQQLLEEFDEPPPRPVPKDRTSSIGASGRHSRRRPPPPI